MDKTTIVLIVVVIISLAGLIYIVLNPAITSAQINAELIEKVKEDKEEYMQKSQEESQELQEHLEGIENKLQELKTNN